MKKLEIEIDLHSKEGFTCDYSDKTLSPDLRDYILNELVGYDTDLKVTFIFKPQYKITEEEKDNLIRIFKKEFRENLTDLEYFRKHSNKRKITLLALGLFFLLIQYSLIEILDAFIQELLNIIGCVCIWEVIYSLLFTEVERSREIKRHKQIINADIEFIEY